MHTQHYYTGMPCNRHFLGSSSCLSLNLLGIAKEHASVFAFIELLDDTYLWSVT